MQISRHWRMNAQRYRLEGTRTLDGAMQFQPHLAANAEMTEAKTGQVVETNGVANEKQPIAVPSARNAAR